MKAYWLPGICRYRRTKAEAQAEAAVSPFEEVNLPDRHQDTVDFLNGMIEQQERTLAASDAAYAREEATATEMGYASLPAALAALRSMKDAEPSTPPEPLTKPERKGDLIEDILGLDETRILDAVAASLDRMHEIAGFRGWHAFAKKTLSWSGGSLATDRGLGMLVMAGLASLGQKPEEKP